ncbi:RNA methyltransferase [Acidithiobacillus concretivorus]|uniref:tRNA (cytidine/uridine-2'-O-)-methyltransferase TrmJ n=1 Tax=Acidithiobacillus concretivorus TaxID=3063952 RepID=A0ABS5ZP56_9PROT|nr:RNA methyltransferase [Acidithiobacillus concretivorus]MBU2738403.1 RNA methyltransferase [Acidithiobacillus concretivorus]
MSTKFLEGLRVVLVETSHPGNIGATARAMKVMGLQHLVLVNPRFFPHPEATALASGAEDVLERAQVTADLATALQGCHKVYGTSARDRRIQWPVLDAREAAVEMVAELAAGNCALVFGRERTGLSNEELDHCQVLVNIPTAELYHSLNLGQAVQVLAYELHMATRCTTAEWCADTDATSIEVAAPMEDMEGFYGHLEQVLRQSGFLQEIRAIRMMRRLRRLYDRARPTANEVNILRGILTEIQRWATNSRQKGSG